MTDKVKKTKQKMEDTVESNEKGCVCGGCDDGACICSEGQEEDIVEKKGKKSKDTEADFGEEPMEEDDEWDFEEDDEDDFEELDEEEDDTDEDW